jgi:hypothetical protein
VPGAHLRQAQAREPDRGHQVKVHSRQPVIISEVVENSGFRTSRIIEHYVGTIEPVDGLVHNTLQVAQSGDVGAQPENLSPIHGDAAYIRRRCLN